MPRNLKTWYGASAEGSSSASSAWRSVIASPAATARAATILPDALQAGHDLVLALDRALGAALGSWIYRDSPALPGVRTYCGVGG